MRFCETNVHLHDQVLSTSCESLVFLLIKNNDDVSRLQSWFLITLATECDLLTFFHYISYILAWGQLFHLLRGIPDTWTVSAASYRGPTVEFAPAFQYHGSWDTSGWLQPFLRLRHIHHR